MKTKKEIMEAYGKIEIYTDSKIDIMDAYYNIALEVFVDIRDCLEGIKTALSFLEKRKEGMDVG